MIHAFQWIISLSGSLYAYIERYRLLYTWVNFNVWTGSDAISLYDRII